jgi:hypothetical protein
VRQRRPIFDHEHPPTGNLFSAVRHHWRGRLHDQRVGVGRAHVVAELLGSSEIRGIDLVDDDIRHAKVCFARVAPAARSRLQPRWRLPRGASRRCRTRRCMKRRPVSPLGVQRVRPAPLPEESVHLPGRAVRRDRLDNADPRCSDLRGCEGDHFIASVIPTDDVEGRRP